MRLGSWLTLVGLAVALPTPACSGGYPLPPTRCDEFCDVTKGEFCQDYYNPASCVAECESSDLDREICRGAFDEVLSCFRSSPRALEQRCAYDNVPDDCANEQQALGLCAVSGGLR